MRDGDAGNHWLGFDTYPCTGLVSESADTIVPYSFSLFLPFLSFFLPFLSFFLQAEIRPAVVGASKPVPRQHMLESLYLSASSSPVPISVIYAWNFSKRGLAALTLMGRQCAGCEGRTPIDTARAASSPVAVPAGYTLLAFESCCDSPRWFGCIWERAGGTVRHDEKLLSTARLFPNPELLACIGAMQ